MQACRRKRRARSFHRTGLWSPSPHHLCRVLCSIAENRLDVISGDRSVPGAKHQQGKVLIHSKVLGRRIFAGLAVVDPPVFECDSVPLLQASGRLQSIRLTTQLDVVPAALPSQHTAQDAHRSSFHPQEASRKTLAEGWMVTSTAFVQVETGSQKLQNCPL